MPDNKKTDARARRLKRVEAALCCPDCGGDLSFSGQGAHCAACSRDYPLTGGRLHFVDRAERSDHLDILKGGLKSLLGPLYYSVGMRIFAPTFPFNYRQAIRRHVDPSQELVVDIGSGNHRVDEDIICIDLFGYEQVDIVCDLGKLPFKTGSVGAFTSHSVLEHVPKLPALADQLARCTRPGGLGLHLIPFLYPYHASPGDFTRLTHTGAAGLFPGWDLIDQSNATGPVTYFLLGILEFLTIVLSFGSARVRGPLYLLLCVLTFPIKFLDAPFIGRKAFLAMAPTILTVMRKP